MKLPNPFYPLRRALANLRGAPRAAAVTASTISIVVVLFGAFLLSGENVYRSLVGWAGQGDPLVVYAKRGLALAKAEEIARRIQGFAEVARVKTVAPEEGMQELRRALGSDADVLEGVEPREVLPTAFSVGLRDPQLPRPEIDALTARLRRLEGVETVDSESAWLDRFAKLAQGLVWLGIGWGAILGFGALLVIGNSTRLAALTRKDEIEVLRLVGASDGFIIVPFFLEGAIQGLIGSLIGVAVLAAAFFGIERSFASDALLGPFLADLRFLEPGALATLVVAGPLLGGVGAAGSARRFLRGVEL